MATDIVRIKDSGLAQKGDSTATFTKANSGAWQTYYGFTLRFEFDAAKNNQTGFVNDANDSSFFDYRGNDIGALVAPRITMSGIVRDVDAADITELLNFQRSKGLKQLAGGIGTIGSLPEKQNDGTYDFVYVRIFSVKITESLNNSEDTYNITVQFEVV